MRLFPLLLCFGCAPQLYTDATLDSGQCAGYELPVNDWVASDRVPCGLTPEGFSTGDVVPDLRTVSQTGEQVSIWQFYGQITVIDVSIVNCAPCQQLARGVEETYQELREQDVMYLTVLALDYDGNLPDVEDLEFWAESFDITAPVMADTEQWHLGPAGDSTFPHVLVVGRNLEVCAPDVTTSDAAIREAVAACR